MFNILAFAILQFITVHTSPLAPVTTPSPSPAASGGVGGWGGDIAALGGVGGWGGDIAALGGVGGWGGDITA